MTGHRPETGKDDKWSRNGQGQNIPLSDQAILF